MKFPKVRNKIALIVLLFSAIGYTGYQVNDGRKEAENKAYHTAFYVAEQTQMNDLQAQAFYKALNEQYKEIVLGAYLTAFVGTSGLFLALCVVVNREDKSEGFKEGYLEAMKDSKVLVTNTQTKVEVEV